MAIFRSVQRAANGMSMPIVVAAMAWDNFGYYDPSNSYLVNIPPNNAVVHIVVYPANVPILGQPGKVSPSLRLANLNLYGASGFNYIVQSSTNLAATNWSTLTTVTNFPGSPYLIQDFQATNSTRFYRAPRRAGVSFQFHKNLKHNFHFRFRLQPP